MNLERRTSDERGVMNNERSWTRNQEPETKNHVCRQERGGGQELTVTPKRVAAMVQRGFAASYQFPFGRSQFAQVSGRTSVSAKQIASSVSRSSDLASYKSSRSAAAMARDLSA